MTPHTISRIGRVAGVCLAISVFLAIKLPLHSLDAPYPTNVIVIAYWFLCASAAAGLILRRMFGFWCTYATTVFGFVFGAQISYVPLVLTFTPERLKPGILAFTNLAFTVIVFWLHASSRRKPG